jgi:hypothetical protein
MKRHLALLLLLVPVAAGAQTRPGRLNLTAFTGVRAPFSTGRVAVYDSAGALLATPSQQRNGNPLVGGEARLRLAGPVSLVVTGVYSRAGEDWFVSPDSTGSVSAGHGVRYREETLMGRAGLSLHFASRPDRWGDAPTFSTELVLAGAEVRELRTNHPALSVGFQGALAVGPVLDVVLGIDDYLVMWDKDAFEPQLGSVFQRSYLPTASDVRMRYDASNLLTLRAGLSLRL